MSQCMHKGFKRRLFGWALALMAVSACRAPSPSLAGVKTEFEITIDEHESRVWIHDPVALQPTQNAEIECIFAGGESVKVPCSYVSVSGLTPGGDDQFPGIPGTDKIEPIPHPIYFGSYSPHSGKKQEWHQYSAVIPNRGIPVYFKVWISGHVAIEGKIALKAPMVPIAV